MYKVRYDNEKSKQIENIFSRLLIIIDSKLLKETKKDYINYYYIYLFCIRYKEYLINKEDIRNIVNSKYNADYLSILEMNKELDDEIVVTILDLINEYSNLGKEPYDYRYHILRRKEICDETKKHLLNDYTKEELQNNINLIDEDIDKELSGNENELLDDTLISNQCTVSSELKRVLRGKYE